MHQNTVAARASIDFLCSSPSGDRLTAVAEERTIAGRTGVCDITVRDQQDRLIVLFRGNSYRIQGTILSEDEVHKLQTPES